MRFDEASARYAEFGPFYTGMVGEPRRGAPGAGARLGTAGDRRPRAPSRPSWAELGRVVVAFSGGADSAFVGPGGQRHPRARAACCAPPRCRASLAPEEEADCRALAAEWGLRWAGVPTARARRPGLRGQRRRPLRPLQDGPASTPSARWPPPRRPPWCSGSTSTTSGTTAPARRRRPARGAVFPLVTAGFTKADVRALVAAPRPAHLGQAGRGLPGVAGPLRHPGHRSARLRAVARAESALRALGFGQLRVRHHGDVARIEVPEADLARVLRSAGGRGGRRAPGRLRLRHPRPRGIPLGQPQPGARRRADERRAAGVVIIGPGQAHLPRVAGARPRSSPAWSASSTSSPTSGGPTSTSTRAGSSASSTASPPAVEAGARRGCATRGSRSTCWATSSRASSPRPDPPARAGRRPGGPASPCPVARRPPPARRAAPLRPRTRWPRPP